MAVTRIKLIFTLSLLVYLTISSQGNTSLIQKPIAALMQRRQTLTSTNNLELM
jgi:hypothetical protein